MRGGGGAGWLRKGIKKKHMKWQLSHQAKSLMFTARYSLVADNLRFLDSKWSFSIDDSDGNENFSFKMSSRFGNLCRVYTNSLKMSNVGEFSRSWFLGDRIQVRERKIRCRLFTSSIKRAIRHFYVKVMKWRQRKVQNGVMNVQSYCFAQQTYCFFFKWKRPKRKIWTTFVFATSLSCFLPSGPEWNSYV